MQKRILLITGVPGVGKTTLLVKVIDALNAKGISVGGMVSREVREGNTRAGFEIIDLINDRSGWLSNVNQKMGPQVGKYHVNLQDLDNIGVRAIEEVIEKCSAVPIDEIGPMELFSQKFKLTTKKALESQKLVIAVVHLKTKDALISFAKQREDSMLFTVTIPNRENLAEQLKNQALLFFSSQQVM